MQVCLHGTNVDGNAIPRQKRACRALPPVTSFPSFCSILSGHLLTCVLLKINPDGITVRTAKLLESFCF